MPGFLSHYIAGQAALQALPPAPQNHIHPYQQLYNLGAQGPDIFFYYLPGLMCKRTRGVGRQMHQNDLGIFIAYMAYVAKNAQPPKQDVIFAYTAGLVMHYMLDIHAHPYVYSQTHNHHASGLQNSAAHRHFETSIDIALLDYVKGEKPANYHQWQLIHAEFCQLSTASAAISQGLHHIYQRKIPPHNIHRAMAHMIGITRLLRSRKGRRKKWMAIAENLTVKEPILSSMVHAQSAQDRDYLNQSRKPWIPPWDGGEQSTDSFIDRYTNAVAEGADIITTLHQYVYEKGRLQALANKLGNRSLKTGMPCGGTS